ncbi:MULTISPECIES: toll/interleukin-1 receptor domain-containing protein [Lysinibacillus]|uniref:Toll/interleukin-1 receptor domain-containing protein n=1 Tax=Lysinibacillus capsici TaxID=2115968 RepID=A0ABY8KF55_9BACI|nr:toll/interleukin-1 receptor domain-containing protein [Lysinibacillus capsici]WGF37760.1 toll/interleukin-1 receptor domain-containing protein [Lysinibacillus capsici]
MTQEVEKNPVVFISYTHDSDEHLDRVLEFSNKLRAEGIDAVLDQYEESPPEGWPRWMDRQIRRADYVIMICTPLYFKRVMGEEKQGVGLGGIWESGLIYQHLYNEGGINNKFIPVLFEDVSSYMDIPTPLQGSTHYIANNERSFDRLYWRLRGVSNAAVKPDLGKLRPVEEKERKTMFVTSLIDIEVWNQASWKGCAYLYSPNGELPPAIGLLFENKKAAEVILKQWKSALFKNHSSNDFYEELRISIINTDFEGEKAGYFITVGTNPDGLLKRYKDLGVEVDYDTSLFMMVSRIQYMNRIQGSVHQQIFFDHYSKHGKYFVELGYLENGQINLLKDFRLEKTVIEQRHISEIKEDDLDVSVLGRYQEMLND